MIPQVRRAVDCLLVIVLHAIIGGEAGEHARMQDGFVLNAAQALGPPEATAEIAGLALVVLRPQGIRIELQLAIVDLDAESVRRLSVGKVLRRMHHPAQ